MENFIDSTVKNKHPTVKNKSPFVYSTYRAVKNKGALEKDLGAIVYSL